MQRSFGRATFLILASTLLISGCSKNPTPPPPLAIDQATESFESVFKPSKPGGQLSPDLKQLVDEASGALKSKNFTTALFALQSLSSRSDLTPAQRDFVTRSMLAAQKALEEQASTGDQKAQQALELRRATK